MGDLRHLSWAIQDLPESCYEDITGRLIIVDTERYYKDIVTRSIIVEADLREQAEQFVTDSNYKDATYILNQVMGPSEFSERWPYVIEALETMSNLGTLYEKLGNLAAAEKVQEHILFDFGVLASQGSDYQDRLIKEVDKLDFLYTQFFLRSKEYSFARPERMAAIARWAVFYRAAVLEVDELNEKILLNTQVGLPPLPLHVAVSIRALGMTKKLLEKFRCNVDDQDDNGLTAMHIAAGQNEPAALKMLLFAGAEKELCTQTGLTALHKAAGVGSLYNVQILIDAGASITTKCCAGKTALHYAAGVNDTNVRTLLVAGADVSVRDYDGETALQQAARLDDDKIARLLLGAGADLESEAFDGRTPFLTAAAYGTAAMVRFLAKEGAHAQAKDRSGRTALHLAVSRNLSSNPQYKVIGISLALLESSVDKDATDDQGETALILAIKSGSLERARLLLDHGANLEVAGIESKETPLFYAVHFGHESITSLLLEKGANTEARNADGHMPVHIAAFHGKANMVKCLLDGGANINAQDSFNNTPLHLAATRGNTDQEEEGSRLLIKLLLEKGALVQAKNRVGDTPLHIAMRMEDPKIVRTLLETQSVGDAATNLILKNDFGSSPWDSFLCGGIPMLAGPALERRKEIKDILVHYGGHGF